jgi:hypothetical protein
MHFSDRKAEIAGKLKYASEIPIFEIANLRCTEPAVKAKE